MESFSICFLDLTKMHLKPFEALLDTFVFFSFGKFNKFFCVYFLKASLNRLGANSGMYIFHTFSYRLDDKKLGFDLTKKFQYI